MHFLLKQSTAVDIGFGPFLDETDGKTSETALTITQPDIRLKKNGGAWAQKNAAQTLSHEENGWYEVALDTTDTNTLGILIIAIHESGALPVWKEYIVVPANVYDSLVNGSDSLDVEVATIAANAITATAIASNAITSAKIAADAIGASQLAADAIGASELASGAVSEIADAVWDEVASGHTSAGTFGSCVTVRANTAQSVANGSITLDASASSTDDIYNGCIVMIMGNGTTQAQARLITDYNGTTKVATVTPNFVGTLFGFAAYSILPSGLSDVRVISSGAITADSIATGAIDADAIASDVVTELSTAIAAEIPPSFHI